MAHGLPHLRSKGNRFYWRARIPVDLVERFGYEELHYPLRTSDLAVAKRLTKICDLRVDQLFRFLRSNMSLNKTEITDIARRWLQEALADDEFYRPSKGPWTEDAIDHQADTLAHLESDHRDALARNYFGPVENVVNGLIEHGSLPITEGSPEYSYLSHAILRGVVELLRIQRGRLLGHFHVEPDDPLFKNLSCLDQKVGGAASQLSETPSKPVSHLWQDYKGEKLAGGRWGEKTVIEQDAAIGMFIEIVGDLPVSSVDREVCNRFKRIIQKLPPNWKKRFRGKTVLEVAESYSEGEAISVDTVNKYLGAIESFFGWLSIEQMIGANPAKSLRIKTAMGSDEAKRKPFSHGDLKKIFEEAPLYRGCRSAGRRHAPGDVVIRDSKYWMPLVALYTGARLEEIAQLTVNDIYEREGIWLIDHNDEGEKKLKTRNSRRTIPIHPKLIGCGFVEHMRQVKADGQESLWPDIRVAKGKKKGTPMSKWFGRFLDELGITDKEKVFHSFRHTLANALKQQGTDLTKVSQITGHAEKSMAFGRYAQPYEIAILFEEISKLDYDLDLSHIHAG